MQKLHDTCTVNGCLRPHKARGYCQSHYMQYKRGVPVTAVLNTRVTVKPEHCTVEGCTNEVKGKGLCGMHWMRQNRHGHTKYIDRKKPAKLCTFPECTQWLYAKDLCHQHYIRIRGLKAGHGLTTDQALKLLLEKSNTCEICGGAQTTRNSASARLHDLYLDHDHKTGKLRGFLCNNCNRVLGMMKDSPELLEKAAAYLRKHATT